jgi:predicted DNA-binding protein
LIVVVHWCNTFIESKPVMPTAKKRIHITVDDEVYEALERLSGKRNQSVAGVGLSLIEAALEYQEDLYFSRVADERLSKKDRRIAHDKAWD